MARLRRRRFASAGDRYMFRTPSLRNVTVEAAYMHDGAYTSLRQRSAITSTLWPRSGLTTQPLRACKPIFRVRSVRRDRWSRPSTLVLHVRLCCPPENWTISSRSSRGPSSIHALFRSASERSFPTSCRAVDARSPSNSTGSTSRTGRVRSRGFRAAQRRGSEDLRRPPRSLLCFRREFTLDVVDELSVKLKQAAEELDREQQVLLPVR
jgi:hypothetical protein